MMYNFFHLFTPQVFNKDHLYRRHYIRHWAWPVIQQITSLSRSHISKMYYKNSLKHLPRYLFVFSLIFYTFCMSIFDNFDPW
jgi:hypothetical protein